LPRRDLSSWPAVQTSTKFFPQEQVATVAESGSIRPTGSFKPFALLPSEKKAAKVAPSMLIDLHDITDREAAY